MSWETRVMIRLTTRLFPRRVAMRVKCPTPAASPSAESLTRQLLLRNPEHPSALPAARPILHDQSHLVCSLRFGRPRSSKSNSALNCFCSMSCVQLGHSDFRIIATFDQPSCTCAGIAFYAALRSVAIHRVSFVFSYVGWAGPDGWMDLINDECLERTSHEV